MGRSKCTEVKLYTCIRITLTIHDKVIGVVLLLCSELYSLVAKVTSPVIVRAFDIYYHLTKLICLGIEAKGIVSTLIQRNISLKKLDCIAFCTHLIGCDIGTVCYRRNCSFATLLGSESPIGFICEVFSYEVLIVDIVTLCIRFIRYYWLWIRTVYIFIISILLVDTYVVDVIALICIGCSLVWIAHPASADSQIQDDVVWLVKWCWIGQLMLLITAGVPVILGVIELTIYIPVDTTWQPLYVEYVISFSEVLLII